MKKLILVLLITIPIFGHSQDLLGYLGKPISTDIDQIKGTNKVSKRYTTYKYIGWDYYLEYNLSDLNIKYISSIIHVLW
jgi:hypothetical protein